MTSAGNMNNMEKHADKSAAGRPAKPAPRPRPKRSAGRAAREAVWFSAKILAIPVLCLAALILGLAIGYSVLGDRDPAEVFDWRTWKHMWDLVFADG